MNSSPSAGETPPRGLWIAIFGPDGVGKSAMIEQLKAELAPAFARVTQFHFRPMFCSSQVGRPPVVHPHAMQPRRLVVSFVILVYWLLDCWYGYLIAIRPALRRSELVIFDRYYLDILVDPLRYRLSPGSLRVAKWFTALTPRPGLCILLDASAEVVRRRKCEVSPVESQRQRMAYLKMFESLPDSAIVDADRPIDRVTKQVVTIILRAVGSPSSQQPEVQFLANL